MSKPDSKKYYNFAESFLFGEELAEQRIKLARKYDNEDITGEETDIQRYILLRKELAKKLVSEPKKGFVSILGYAYGTYTTFCWFQFQLNDFDKEINGLTKSAREGLSS